MNSPEHASFLLALAGGLALVLVFWIVFVYNRWVSLALMADNAWSDVDVFLKKRHDLVPNLVALLQTYMGHEKKSLEGIAHLRQAAQNLHGRATESRFGVENDLKGSIRNLLVQVEAYPNLKADAQFRQLADKLTQVENEIEASRRYYNALVSDYNTSIQLFPNLLLSGIFRTRRRALFSAEGERDPVTVNG
ncbi:MAG: LemA family protein [Spirochaetia bacterium]|nr:LemA family protein [Spirochaetia bacterium]